MSIQDKINKAMDNLQWASMFYSQTPMAKHSYNVKKAKKDIENLRNTPSQQDLEEQLLDELREAGTLSDATMGPALETAHKKAYEQERMYADAWAKLYNLEPTLENKLQLQQAQDMARSTKEAGPQTVEGYKAEAQRKIAMSQPGIQYSEPIGPLPEKTMRARYEQNQPQLPKEGTYTRSFTPQEVREGIGRQMIKRIQQEVDREQFRETSRTQLDRIKRGAGMGGVN